MNAPSKHPLIGRWVHTKIPAGALSRLGQVKAQNGPKVFLIATDNLGCDLHRTEFTLLPDQPGFDLVSRREILPYGVWTCADGRQVIFNRGYKPIWQRTADGAVTPADRDEWVEFTSQRWFYDNVNVPWRDLGAAVVCDHVLAAWHLIAENLLQLRAGNRDIPAGPSVVRSRYLNGVPPWVSSDSRVTRPL